MSVTDNNERNSTSDKLFTVRHQHKQRLLLRALESLPQDGETEDESKAIAAMIVRLEIVLARRRRRRKLGATTPHKPRKRCTYGARETTYSND